ncbi:MAG: AMP-binding protein [Myxococcota bacterium]|jgi:long-chain acyl-CoA synthetase|nr:AMP-binding protein [Myxococcota bacterium]
MRNFAMHFWRTIAGHGDAIALVSPGENNTLTEVTFNEWVRRVHRLAVGLMEKGVEPGTRVGLISQNCTDLLTFAASAWVVGACLVPLVPGRERRELLRCLARSGTEWIVVRDRDGLDQIRGQAANLPEHLQWVLLDGDKAPTAPNVHTLDAILEAGHYRERRGGEKQLAKRMFEQPLEQPTTIFFAPEPGDDPHGAFFDGERTASLISNLGQDLLLEEDDRVALILSYGWFHAFLVAMATLFQGKAVVTADSLGDVIGNLGVLAPTHLLTGPAFLEGQARKWQSRIEAAPEFLKKMTEEPDQKNRFSLSRALGVFGERAADRVLAEPIRQDLGVSLRAIYVVEGKLPDEVHGVLSRAQIQLLGLHGYPECGITHLERIGAQRRNSVGRPLQGVACKIEDARGDEAGQILIRSESMARGYWDEEGPRTVKQGWLYTGDIGRIEEGFLLIGAAPANTSDEEAKAQGQEEE